MNKFLDVVFRSRFRLSILLCSFLLLQPISTHAQSPGNNENPRPLLNVLMLAIDDLNDWVTFLDGHADVKTPNLDRLTKRGTYFTNAHCQAPICNPSRTSLMYGLRPSTTGIYMNSPLPTEVPDVASRVTLPRCFAAQGYETLACGKIYHKSMLPASDFRARKTIWPAMHPSC